MKTPLFRSALIAIAPLLASSCVSTRGYLHKDQTITVSQGSKFSKGNATSYWIVGAKPGQVNNAEGLSIYRKGLVNSQSAAPLKCSGFVDTTRSSRIDVELAEKHGPVWQQARVNGTHKLVDESAPKPFYHWLIP